MAAVVASVLPEGGVVAEGGGAVLADVGPLPGVLAARVRLERPGLREGGRAEGAAVRLLPSVLQQVAGEVAGGGEGHGAVGAGKGALARVLADVHLQGDGLREGTAAHPAGEGPLPAVRAQVGLEVACQGEGQGAVRALVGHVGRVLHRVLAHVARVQHHRLAVAAPVASIRLLAEQVVLQQAAVGEGLVAVHAPVRLHAPGRRAPPAGRGLGLRGDVGATLRARVWLLLDLDLLPSLPLLLARRLGSLWGGRGGGVVHGALEVGRVRRRGEVRRVEVRQTGGGKFHGVTGPHHEGGQGRGQAARQWCLTVGVVVARHAHCRQGRGGHDDRVGGGRGVETQGRVQRALGAVEGKHGLAVDAACQRVGRLKTETHVVRTSVIRKSMLRVCRVNG